MIVISIREFRDRQTHYLTRAGNGENVVLKSRAAGSFKIVPITEDDTLMSKEDFFAKIERSLQAAKEGKGKKYTLEELRIRMGLLITTDNTTRSR